MSEAVLESLGDALRVHHAFSRQPLTKDRFEFAFERALTLAGISSALVETRTNRGHDMTIRDVPIGLKTEAAKGIKADVIHVSKWMELGKGEWQLDLLLAHFLDHLKNYDRVLTLRCLKRGPIHYLYELVEIPKAILLRAKFARLEVRENSSQNPKPGYGYVTSDDGKPLFELYFDGGSERKLQIKKLSKTLCKVHAPWDFEAAAI